MSQYRKLAQDALKNSKEKKKRILNEGVVYPENINERMHPSLEEDIINQRHSLAKHPAIPEEDESLFEEKIIGDRFSELCKRYKITFYVDKIDKKQNII